MIEEQYTTPETQPSLASPELSSMPPEDLGETPLDQPSEWAKPPSAEMTPYYALNEEEIRRKVADAFIDTPDKPAPAWLLQESDIQPDGQEKDIIKAEVMARTMHPYMIAAKAELQEAKSIIDSMKPVGEGLKNNAVFLAAATLRQPLKIVRASKKIWDGGTLENKAWNAAQIVGTQYDRMVAAALPFVQKLDVLDILPVSTQVDIRPHTPEQSDKKFKLATEQLTEQLHLDEQLHEQLSVLYKAGIVEQFPSGDFGMQSEDGQTFMAPTPHEVRELVEKHTELIRYKANQGFTRLLVVPNAIAPEKMAERFQDRVIAHFQEGSLFDTHNEPVNLNRFGRGNPPEIRVIADESRRLAIEDLGDKSHADDNSPSKTRGAKSAQPDHGWSLMLAKNMPELPATPREVVSLGGRGEFLSGLDLGPSAADYLHLLHTSQLLRGESGMTLNAWLTYALSELEREDVLIDSRSGTLLLGSSTPGAIFSKRRIVPWVGWELEPSKGNNSRREPLVISAVAPRKRQSAGMRTIVELHP